MLLFFGTVAEKRPLGLVLQEYDETVNLPICGYIKNYWIKGSTNFFSGVSSYGRAYSLMKD